MSAKAKRAALNLWREHGSAIPVDIGEIIRTEGIVLQEESLEDDVSGMLVIKDSQVTIGVNSCHHPNRRRFTMAHELGHYVLHRSSSNVFFDESLLFFRNQKSSEGTQRQEIEANNFAAELLMPEPAIRQRLENPIDAFNDKEVSSLASEFNVSSQALTIRLTKLGLLSTV